MSLDAIQIKTVAVVGAGLSGVCSAAHLMRQGLVVTLFERSKIAGGVWHFDERSALDPPYPNEKPSSGDYVRHQPSAGCYHTPARTPTRTESHPQGSTSRKEEVPRLQRQNFEINHAPPGPCYAGLKNNVSLPQMKTTLCEWPGGLEDFMNQRYLEEYIQKICRLTNVDSMAHFDTRVEEVRKPRSQSSWVVRTTPPRNSVADEESLAELIEEYWKFDAVVVASGHYNMPRIPDIPGLKEFKERFPDRVMHSKGYRSPSLFKNKRLLLVGAGVSSTDIAKECQSFAEKIFQSSRGGVLDLPPQMLPRNAVRIGGIKSFHMGGELRSLDIGPEEHIPGHVELNDGSKLSEIDNVVLATGYVTSYPFLPSYQSDVMKATEADDRILVTAEGDMVHNLLQDIFYIPDPTLAFVGVPYHVSTFSLFEFQAQVVARVFAGLARLPAQINMRVQYRERTATRKLGRDFHSLRPEGDELAYVKNLVAWMNSEAERVGAPPMLGHSDEFLKAYKEQRERLKLLGLNLERTQ